MVIVVSVVVGIVVPAPSNGDQHAGLQTPTIHPIENYRVGRQCLPFRNSLAPIGRHGADTSAAALLLWHMPMLSGIRVIPPETTYRNCFSHPLDECIPAINI